MQSPWKQLVLGCAIAVILITTTILPLKANIIEMRPGTPASPTGSRIAVANRGTNTVTLIDIKSERTIDLILEKGSEPMYAQNTFFTDEIWLGDRGNNRVLVYDALRLRRKAEIPTGRGVFHMWNNGTLGQMWVVNDIDKTMTVIDLRMKKVLATVSIPADLAPNFKPHDVTVTSDSAIVSLLSANGSDEGWLIKYSGESFQETNRVKVGGDPHLFYWGFSDSLLYVATQIDGKVLKMDPSTLELLGEIDIPGAHGIWADESETNLYVTDIESSDGKNSVYTIDLASFSLVPGTPADAPLPFPHNVMVSLDNKKLFITHSQDSEFTSIYDLDKTGVPEDSRIIKTGATPFGIMLVRDPVAYKCEKRNAYRKRCKLYR
ncbi:hypothetical protein BC008_10430 [Mastigocoleus testarum BC008]|uniref:Methanethiol oxidase n=2 Tax=Mastigocoleus TaxID=996924 RepID=A0A0V7ZDG2_9CYAN|nr:hypothetical protein BC008_10235 [Mastigocoleus testarum BC008]KST62578.1 hypothetical protein BC008_10430 [Mastigocoleus testarum BC008]